MYRVDPYDGLASSYLSSDMDPSINSDSSSLNSSILDNNIGSRQALYIHADSLESLDDLLADDEGAEIMAFKNTSALCDDLRFISGMPEICDIKFLVGQERAPVYGVKAILSTRCRVFYEMIISAQKSQGKRTETKPKVGKTQKFLSKFLKFRKQNQISRDVSKQKVKHVSKSDHLTIDIEQFSADTFKRVVLYLHCGSTSVSLHSVIGVMNAADCYGVEDLRSACYEFALRFINLRTVLRLLVSTDIYSEHKWTRTVVAKIFEFIEKNGEDVLRLDDFETLPKQTAIWIISRLNLRATEEAKWNAALGWSRRHLDLRGLNTLRCVMQPFIEHIHFLEIPLSKLRSEIRPLSVVPDDVINRAIVHQASTRFVIGQERFPVSTWNVSQRRSNRRSIDSITWARNYVRRRSSLNSVNSDFSRANSCDSGFVSSSEEGFSV